VILENPLRLGMLVEAVLAPAAVAVSDQNLKRRHLQKGTRRLGLKLLGMLLQMLFPFLVHASVDPEIRGGKPEIRAAACFG
jgi:hypothetical protein